MDKPIDILRKLQEIDGRMRLARQASRTSETRLAEDTKALEEARRSLEETEENVKRLQREVDRQNVELRAAEENISKLEGQLMSLKTNEEYAAMQKQISDRRAGVSQLEERILEAMEVVDQAAQAIPGRRQELEGRQAVLSASEERVAKENREIEQKLAALQEEWNGIAADLPADVVEDYVLIRDRRGGDGVVRLTAEGLCEGCHMGQPPQVLNDLMKGGIVRCSSCQRFLWLD